MREIRLSGSEGGGTGNSTGPPYPYQRTNEPIGIGRAMVVPSGALPALPQPL